MNGNIPLDILIIFTRSSRGKGIYNRGLRGIFSFSEFFFFFSFLGVGRFSDLNLLCFSNSLKYVKLFSTFCFKYHTETVLCTLNNHCVLENLQIVNLKIGIKSILFFFVSFSLSVND